MNTIAQSGQNLDEYKAETERKRLEFEEKKFDIEYQKMNFDGKLRVFDAIIKFAEITVRSLLILNGGAALGFITFASARMRDGKVDGAAQVILLFGLGAAAAVLCAGFSYFSQASYGDDNDRTGNILRFVAIGGGFLSWFLFLAGILYIACHL